MFYELFYFFGFLGSDMKKYLVSNKLLFFSIFFYVVLLIKTRWLLFGFSFVFKDLLHTTPNAEVGVLNQTTSWSSFAMKDDYGCSSLVLIFIHHRSAMLRGYLRVLVHMLTRMYPGPVL